MSVKDTARPREDQQATSFLPRPRQGSKLTHTCPSPLPFSRVLNKDCREEVPLLTHPHRVAQSTRSRASQGFPWFLSRTVRHNPNPTPNSSRFLFLRPGALPQACVLPCCSKSLITLICFTTDTFLVVLPWQAVAAFLSIYQPYLSRATVRIKRNVIT